LTKELPSPFVGSAHGEETFLPCKIFGSKLLHELGINVWVRTAGDLVVFSRLLLTKLILYSIHLTRLHKFIVSHDDFVGSACKGETTE
jgi:hypothetical protein